MNNADSYFEREKYSLSVCLCDKVTKPPEGGKR